MDEARFVTIDNTLSKLVKEVLPKFVARIKDVESAIADTRSSSDKFEGVYTAYRLENDARIASMDATTSKLMEATTSKLEELYQLVANYEGRIARLEGQMGVALNTVQSINTAIQNINEKLDAAPVTPEKPKRKRRTKAEIEAEKEAKEQEAINAEVPQPMDPSEPEMGVGLVPETVAGVDITRSVVFRILSSLKTFEGNVDTLIKTSPDPEEVIRYVLALPPEVAREIITKFPD